MTLTKKPVLVGPAWFPGSGRRTFLSASRQDVLAEPAYDVFSARPQK